MDCVRGGAGVAYHFQRKFRKFCFGNFCSVRTVCVVYHLPKISGLSRRARLDSGYNMKLQTPDNSNLQGKSKKVRVIGSSKKIAGSKEKQFLLHSEHFNHL